MNQKFRAIIKDIGTIYFDFESLVRHPHPIFIIRLRVLPWLRLGNQPDRFTGLWDKNNKEIYESDILATPKGIYYIVKALPFISLIDLEGRHYDNGDYYSGFDITTHQWQRFEVLGNIHENIQLLKGRNETN